MSSSDSHWMRTSLVGLMAMELDCCYRCLMCRVSSGRYLENEECVVI